jgi:hypothetical protein
MTYTATDREGVVYRRWDTDQATAIEYAFTYVQGWTLLVDSIGRTILDREWGAAFLADTFA